MAKISINIATGSLQEKEVIVGIDLGTTNSLIAIVRDEDGIRKPLALRETDGLTLVPSIVHFGAGGEINVGNEARQYLISEPAKTIYSVKRLMGKSYTDVRAHADAFAYKVMDDDTDALVKIEIDGRFYSPIELSSYILAALKGRAEHLLKTPVTRAVITVPAYFNDTQRQATRDAGRLAGLDVLRVVNEPTAAALAYGMGLSPDEEKTVAVYDLGGGTFDVSILRISGGLFEVLSTAGDTYLGGDDFDRTIAEHFESQIADSGSSISKGELRLIAEDAKKQLSSNDAYESLAGGHSLRITKDELNALINPIVERTLESCALAVKDAAISLQEIDAVVMVGGSTRVPLVKDSVRKFFGRELFDELNPDEVVALGAAVQADILAGNNTEMLLLDVTPLSLGIETMGGLMDVLIPRNSKIPVKAARQYTTDKEGQRSMRITVYQGERDLVQHNRKLAEFTLSDIPAMPAGFPKVEITFLIDADGILKVSAQELRSGVAQAIDVKPQYGLTDADVERLLLDSLVNAKEDMLERALAEASTEAQQMIDVTERFLKKNQSLLNEAEITVAKSYLSKLQDAVAAKDKNAIHAATEALNDATRPFAERVMDAALKTAMRGQKIG